MCMLVVWPGVLWLIGLHDMGGLMCVTGEDGEGVVILNIENIKFKRKTFYTTKDIF